MSCKSMVPLVETSRSGKEVGMGQHTHIKRAGYWCFSSKRGGSTWLHWGDHCTWMTEIHIYRVRNPFSFYGIIPAGVSLVTLTAHFMTSAVSSDTTRSTHLRLGSLSLRICFFTIASKARSGVKSPVLKGHGVILHLVSVVEREG